MEIETLEEIGLSKGETKIYVTLLKLGQAKAGSIIEKSHMASSAVHNAINSLIDKGIISYIKKGPTKFYKATPPDRLGEIFLEKKKNLEKNIAKLKEIETKSKDKQDAEIFEGTKGLLTMLNLLISNSKKGDEYLFFTVNYLGESEEFQEFFKMYDIKRKEKGLKIKGLSPPDLRKWFKDRKMLNVKFTDSPIPSNISVCGNKVVMFSWGEKPVGYLIQSKQISQMYRDLFHKIWEQAKK